MQADTSRGMYVKKRALGGVLCPRRNLMEKKNRLKHQIGHGTDDIGHHPPTPPPRFWVKGSGDGKGLALAETAHFEKVGLESGWSCDMWEGLRQMLQGKADEVERWHSY